MKLKVANSPLFEYKMMFKKDPNKQDQSAKLSTSFHSHQAELFSYINWVWLLLSF